MNMKKAFLVSSGYLVWALNQPGFLCKMHRNSGEDGDDDVGVVDVGELELDDQGRALLCEHWEWCGRGRKLQMELTR